MEVWLGTGSGEGWLRDDMTGHRGCHKTVKRLWDAEVHRVQSRTRVTQKSRQQFCAACSSNSRSLMR